jgi:hypothetical protein
MTPPPPAPATDYGDLVQELREEAYDGHHKKLMLAAADAIELLAQGCETCRWQRHESNHPPLCGRVTCGPYSVHISCERFGNRCGEWSPREEGRTWAKKEGA